DSRHRGTEAQRVISYLVPTLCVGTKKKPLVASKVRDYKIPNQPPNKKWKFLYDQDKLGSYRMVIKQFSCPTCEIQKVSRWDREP
ncbi:MAG: hypothetical protein KAR36_14180, partial [Candidatus Latescibacteria bacterium]|nr:hypothetical protein [Candidatus Latescibacterota bacterium]